MALAGWGPRRIAPGQKVGVMDEVRIKLMFRTASFYGDGKLAACPSIPA